MGLQINETITLRTARGVVEAVIREVSDTELHVEGQVSLRPGREVEFQFPLPGAHANLKGRAKVAKVVELALSPTRLVLDQLEMNRNHVGLLREWLEERQRAERQAKPKLRRPPSVEEIRSAGSGSLVSSISQGDDTTGRQAISETIVEGSDRKRSRRSQLRKRVRAQRGDADEPERKRRKRRRVEVKVASNASPPIVQIRFNDPERYVQYYWKHIHRLALQVRYADAELEKNGRVSVRLVLPGGSVVKCSGVVKVSMPSGFGLMLELDDKARSTLRLSAGPRPREV